MVLLAEIKKILYNLECIKFRVPTVLSKVITMDIWRIFR